MEIDVIHNMDCLEGMKMLPDGCVDLTVTSPPYDNLRTYKGYSFDFEGIAHQLYRVTKPGGVVVWVVGDATVNGSETGTSFRQALFFKEIGFRLHDTMIYQKDSCPFPETTRYYPGFEFMFVLAKGPVKTVNLIADKPNVWFGKKPIAQSTQREPDGTTKAVSAAKTNPDRNVKCRGVRSNVWQVSAGYLKSSKDPLAFEHPAIFPEQLAKDHILSWSNPGHTVLDCFMGSGTTAVACINTERHYIGFEISAEYAAIAERRIERVRREIESRGGKLFG